MVPSTEMYGIILQHSEFSEYGDINIVWVSSLHEYVRGFVPEDGGAIVPDVGMICPSYKIPSYPFAEITL